MSSATETIARAAALGGVTPILRVRDLAASVDYYVNKLGFRVRWGFPGDGTSFFAAVSRGNCSLFLSVGDRGHPGTWVWIGVDDVEALHEELCAAGAVIRNPPTNYEWALEMQVEDPDGNLLRIGSEPKPNEPIGPWLDMNGDRWVHSPNGGFEKLPH